METASSDLEHIRQRQRERMELMLANRRPLTEVEWVAQVKQHAKAGSSSFNEPRMEVPVLETVAGVCRNTLPEELRSPHSPQILLHV